MTEKLCKDCHYHFVYYDTHRCKRPIVHETSLITGEVEIKPGFGFCETERKDCRGMDRCGSEGKYWTPRKSFWEGLSDAITGSL